MAENYTDDGEFYNLNYAVGEQNSSVTLRLQHGTAAARLAAAKSIGDLLETKIDAALMSISARQSVTNNTPPADTAARIYPTRLNFKVLYPAGGVDRLTIFIPWAIGLDQVTKASLGASIANEMSVPDTVTYVFVS